MGNTRDLWVDSHRPTVVTIVVTVWRSGQRYRVTWVEQEHWLSVFADWTISDVRFEGTNWITWKPLSLGDCRLPVQQCFSEANFSKWPLIIRCSISVVRCSHIKVKFEQHVLTDVRWGYVKKLWRVVPLIFHLAVLVDTTFDHDLFLIIEYL